MRAATWHLPFATTGCIDPIFMPKIAFAQQEDRLIGSKDRIVLREK